jgi:hypothetical protein
LDEVSEQDAQKVECHGLGGCLIGEKYGLIEGGIGHQRWGFPWLVYDMTAGLCSAHF